MRTTLALMAVILVLVTGCAATQQQKVEDHPAVCRFLGEACHNLTPGGRRRGGLRYANPKANLTQYNR